MSIRGGRHQPSSSPAAAMGKGGAPEEEEEGCAPESALDDLADDPDANPLGDVAGLEALELACPPGDGQVPRDEEDALAALVLEHPAADRVDDRPDLGLGLERPRPGLGEAGRPLAADVEQDERGHDQVRRQALDEARDAKVAGER